MVNDEEPNANGALDIQFDQCAKGDTMLLGFIELAIGAAFCVVHVYQVSDNLKDHAYQFMPDEPGTAQTLRHFPGDES